jgi:hypothetical protein
MNIHRVLGQKYAGAVQMRYRFIKAPFTPHFRGRCAFKLRLHFQDKVASPWQFEFSVTIAWNAGYHVLITARETLENQANLRENVHAIAGAHWDDGQ